MNELWRKDIGILCVVIVSLCGITLILSMLPKYVLGALILLFTFIGIATR